MSLTASRRRALEIVRDHGPIAGGDFASRMWPDSPAWKHQSKAGNYGSRQGAGMPRAGGSYLAVLKTAGLVVLTTNMVGDTWRPTYAISRAGREALANPES